MAPSRSERSPSSWRSCYRPAGEKWVFAPALLIFLANLGGHSLWLSGAGETLRCEVGSVASRRSPTSYGNELDCGGRAVDYRPTANRSAQQPGSEMDLVVDRTGFAGNPEPDKVSLGRTLLTPLVLLMNATFIGVVARRPVRTPAKLAE